MSVFNNCSVFLEVGDLSSSQRKKLRSAVMENGGCITFTITAQCSLVVVSDMSRLSTSRMRAILKHCPPVVRPEYVLRCVESGQRLPMDTFKFDRLVAPPLFTPDVLALPPVKPTQQAPPTEQGPDDMQLVETRVPSRQTKMGVKFLGSFRVYHSSDADVPTFPHNFHVAKSSFYSDTTEPCCVLELQSCRVPGGQMYRVLTQWKDGAAGEETPLCDMVFPSTSEEALELYLKMSEALEICGLQRCRRPSHILDLNLGSSALHQLLLEEQLDVCEVPQREVCVLVELLWTEALGCLHTVIKAPIHSLSLSDVCRAEGLLLQAHRKLGAGEVSEASALLTEFCCVLPHRAPPAAPSVQLLSQKLDLCQVLRDVLSLSETVSSSSSSFSVGKFRALRCVMAALPADCSEYQRVAKLLRHRKVLIQQIVRVTRVSELQAFRRDIGNIKALLHSSSPKNFVGILSRGLLLPRVAVEAHGVQRTDVGKLGAGIYFSTDVGASLQYSSPSSTDGSRLLLVCDVALGKSLKVYQEDVKLTEAPEGFHSVIGTKGPNAKATPTFQDDEYVVYNPEQVQVKYLVQFTTEGDELKDFSPNLDFSEESSSSASLTEGQSFDEQLNLTPPHPVDPVVCGLLSSHGQQLPLQAVHVKCKLMDLLCQVVIFQKYTNHSTEPIEAKYVFPLQDCAAVCGFEAFINGKHVVGKVKEKEEARREYRQAVRSGHGAYLMDQEAADVFTISVGNLPPASFVFIKVTFISELVISRSGAILFSLPCSVAPWQESTALNQNTQNTVRKVQVNSQGAASREFTLDLSLEMPCVISDLQCITHRVKMKRTDCMAVLSVLPGSVLGADGFQLSISLSDVHLPRMWVENHPDKDSQACMLVFYPDFESGCSTDCSETLLLLDTSSSMRGDALRTAQSVALLVLRNLPHHTRVNVILFATEQREVFLTARALTDARQELENFIRHPVSVGGSTELWRPLQALSLLPPTRGVRNLLLLSDGHIQSSELTLRLVRDNQRHSRLFCCGLSPTANQHMLRALAQAGGGAYEFFDQKSKHSWEEKAVRQVQRMCSLGCSSVSVKWQQLDSRARPLQAPCSLQALFNNSHTLVYGFVPHCTQASLTGTLGSQELETMVSTTELQKTTGTFLHKLTARAIIRDYEDGNLDIRESEHEGKKLELKSLVVELSKEFSILCQFTSFVAVEERDPDGVEDGFTDIQQLLADEDVDLLPYISWIPPAEGEGFEELVETNGSSLILDVAEGPSPSAHSDAALKKDKRRLSFLRKARHSRLPLLDPSQCIPKESDAVLLPAVSLVSKVHDVTQSDVKKPKKKMELESSDLDPVLPEEEDVEELSIPKCSFSPARTSKKHRKVYQKTFDHQAPHPNVAFSSAAPPVRNLRVDKQPSKLLRSRLSVPRASLHSLQDFHARSLPPPPPPPQRKNDSFSLEGFKEPPLPSPQSLSFGFSKMPLFFGSFNEGLSEDLKSVRQSSQLFPGPPPVIGDQLGFTRFDSFKGGLKESNREMQWQTPPRPPLLHLNLCGAAPPPPPPPPPAFSIESHSLESQVCEEKEEEEQQVLSMRFLKDADAVVERPEDHIKLKSDKKALKKLQELRPGDGLQTKLGRRRQEKMCVERDASSPRLVHFVAADESPDDAESFIMNVSADSAGVDLKWKKIFQMQNSEGFWDLSSALGQLINVNTELLSNDFLTRKGINSLGPRARTDILRLLATLLVLQLMRLEKLEEGKLLSGLFSLKETTEPSRLERLEALKKAAAWVRWADWQYPFIYSRLELALSWESFTRQLLGYEDVPPFSELHGLHLQWISPALPVH